MNFITLHRSTFSLIGIFMAAAGAYYVSYVMYREKQNRPLRRPAWVGLLLVGIVLYEAFVLVALT
jgi:hypothetical protein